MRQLISDFTCTCGHKMRVATPCILFVCTPCRLEWRPDAEGFPGFGTQRPDGAEEPDPEPVKIVTPADPITAPKSRKPRKS